MKKLTGDALDSAVSDFANKPFKAQSLKTRTGWFKHTAVTLAAVAIMAVAGLGLTGCGDSPDDSAKADNTPVVMQHEDHRNGASPLITVYPNAEIVVEGVYKDGADREQIYHFDGSRVHQATVDDDMTYTYLRRVDDQSKLRLYQQIMQQGGAPEGAPDDLPPVEVGDGNYRIEILGNNQVVAEHYNINGVPGSRIWFFDNSDIVVNTFGDEAGISRISSTDARNYQDLQRMLQGDDATNDDSVNISTDPDNQSVSKTISVNGRDISLTWEFAGASRASGQLTVEIDGNTNSVPISTARSGFSRQMRNLLTADSGGLPEKGRTMRNNPANR